jgi:hypothetical protein
MKEHASITIDYLKQLERPEEAITEGVWRQIKQQIFAMCNENDEFKKIIKTRINNVAPKLGFIWKNQKDERIIDILTRPLSDIKNRKFMGEWYKKSIILTICNLVDLSSDQYIRLTSEEDKKLKANEIPYNDLRTARHKIHQKLTEIRDQITAENFEDLYTDFLKTFVTSVAELGNFNTKNMERYLIVFFRRFKKSEKYSEISAAMDVNQGVINSILNKFYDEFIKLYVDEKGNYDEGMFVSFVKKWEQFYNSVFITLAPLYSLDNLEERNKKLQGISEFQNYFIGNELADFIE